MPLILTSPRSGREPLIISLSMVNLTKRVDFKKAGTAAHKQTDGARALFLFLFYATVFDLVTR
jgi:hypothetical protein